MKNKTYHYDDLLYTRKVKFAGLYAGVIGLFIFGYLAVVEFNYLYVPILIVSLYTYWETFVSLSNPQDVCVDEEKIVFKGCGKEHTYRWEEIYNFKCKEFYSARKIFLRINKTGLFKGRYWINCANFNDTDELFMFLINKEDEILPDTVKAMSRRNSK